MGRSAARRNEESLREYKHRILTRSFAFPADVRGLFRSKLPPRERHRPLEEIAWRHPEVVAAHLDAVFKSTHAPLADLIGYPDENPLLRLGGPAVEARIDRQVLRPVLRNSRGALDAIRAGTGEDKEDIGTGALEHIAMQVRGRTLPMTAGARALRAVAKNFVIDRYRRAESRPRFVQMPSPLDEEIPDDGDLARTVHEAQRMAEDVEADIDVQHFLKHLSARERQLATLLMGGLSQAEAARRMGIRPQTVTEMRRRIQGKWMAHVS